MDINYTWEKIKQELVELLWKEAGEEIVFPPPDIDADIAIPCFSIARQQRRSPQQIAEEIAKNVKDKLPPLIASVEAIGGYVNFCVDPLRFCHHVIDDFITLKDSYGCSQMGKGKTIIIDFSSPNIAKPFSVGHLRSTIIGQSIYNIYSFLGYRVVGDNHIGDWGTQFGKLIVAYQKWGNKERIENASLQGLLDLYVRFHKEATESLEEEARRWFKKLEDGDQKAVELWEWFKEISLKEFNRIYQKLNIKFDLALGESFYNRMLPEIIEDIEKTGVAERDREGTLLVRLEHFNIHTPLLIQKRDGSSLYSTRDLATAKYRIQHYHPFMIVYVVGSEQKLYFQQWFTVFQQLLGYDVQLVHVDFGLVRLPEGRMSTREGRVIFLEDVINEAIFRARNIIEQKRPSLSEDQKERIAQIVGIAAIKYNDLSQNRVKEVVFDWEKMLSFEGNSAPYLQYSYTRARSILRKANYSECGEDYFQLSRSLKLKEEIELVKRLAKFNYTVKQAAESFHPHIIASYLFELAQLFTAFYNTAPVLHAESKDLRKARLFLVWAYSIVLKNGLSLLGIECLEEM